MLLKMKLLKVIFIVDMGCLSVSSISADNRFSEARVYIRQSCSPSEFLLLANVKRPGELNEDFFFQWLMNTNPNIIVKYHSSKKQVSSTRVYSSRIIILCKSYSMCSLSLFCVCLAIGLV